MFKMFRKNYRRAVAYLLTVAMAFTNLNWNAGAVFAAGESEGALFLVDGQELKQAIDSTVMGGDVFDFSSLELVAEKKSIRNKYKAALGVGNVYELELGVDCQHAPEETSMRVFYSAATRKVIFLFLNESEQAVSFRVNIDGYETAEVEVKPNAERMMDESDRVFAENYESGDMIDDEAKKPSAEVVGSAEDTEAEGKEEEEKDPEAGENTDSETGASEEETSAAGSEADGENAGDKEEVPSGTEALESEGIAEESQEETTAEEKKEAEAEAMTETENEAEKEDRPFEDSDEAAGEEVASISRHEAVLVATANGLPEEGLTAPENMEDEGDKDSEIGDEDHGAEEAPEEDKSEAVDMPEAADPVETAAPTEEVESASGAGEAEGTAGAEETDRETDQAEESNPSEESSSEEESGSAEESNPEEATAPSEGETAAPAESDSQPGEETEAPGESTAENKKKEEGQVLEGENLEHLGALEGRDLPTVTVLDHVNARAFQADVDDIFAIVANAEEDRLEEYDFVLPLSMPDPENEESEEFVPFAKPLGAEMLELKGVAPETKGAWRSSDPEILSIDETGFVETHTLGEVEVSFTYEAFAGEADSADAEGAEEDNGSEVTLTWKMLVYDEQYNMLDGSYQIYTINVPRNVWFEDDCVDINGKTSGEGYLGPKNEENKQIKQQWSMPKDTMNFNGWERKNHYNNYKSGSYTNKVATGTTLHIVGGYSGPVAYCIEPGVTIGNTQSGFTETPGNQIEFDESFTEKKLEQIRRIIKFGYHGNISTFSNGYDKKVAYVIATQLLVWEVVVGERDGDFNHKSHAGDCLWDSINPNHPKYNEIKNYYDDIVTKVKSQYGSPNFGDSNKLVWNGAEYSITLTDSNKVLSEYDVVVSKGNASIEIKENQLTINSNSKEGDIEITATQKENSHITLLRYGDGKYGPNKPGNIQDVVTYGSEVNFPKVSITYSFTVEPTADIVIKKIDSETSKGLNGVIFTLSSPDNNYRTSEHTTSSQDGEEGVIKIDHLRPGTYTLTEVKSPDGYMVPDNNAKSVVFRVTNEGIVECSGSSLADKTITVKNTQKVTITVVKVDQNEGQKRLKGAKFKLSPEVEGGPKGSIYTTGEDGTVLVGKLDKGTYTLTEVEAPEGYMVPEEKEATITFTVVVNKQGIGTVVWDSKNKGKLVNEPESKSVTFNNIKKVNVDIQKLDGNSVGVNALSGAEFDLRQVGSDKILGHYTTSNGADGGVKGRITIPALERGDYTLTETKAPEGYYLPYDASASDRRIAFRVNDNRTVVLLSGISGATGDAQISQAEENTNATITIKNTRAVDLKVIKTVNQKDVEKSEPINKDTFDIEVRLGTGTEERVTDVGSEEGSKISSYQGDGIYKYRLRRSIVDENGNIIEDNSVTITGIPTGKEYTITEVLTDVEDAEGNKLDVIVTDKPSQNTNFDKENWDGQRKEIKGVLTDKVEAEDEVGLGYRIETVTIKNDYFNSKTRDIKVTKSWKDEAGEELEENLRPAEIKVQLMYAIAEKDSEGNLQYGEPKVFDLSYVEDNIVKNDYITEVSLKASEDPEKDWAATFKNLPLYDWDGNEYQYSVVEKEITPNEKWGELGWSVEGTPAPAQIEGSNIFRVYGADKVMKQNTETNEWEETGDYEVRGVFAAASDAVTLPATEEGENLEEPVQYPITNTWIPAEKLGTGFTIKKIDSETGEPLQNAVFAMKFYQEPESEEALSDIGDPEDREEENGETKEPETIFEVKTNEEGFATFPELPVGRYVLWEKTAPEGYLPIPEEMKLIVNIRKDLVEVFSEDEEQKVWKNRYQWSNEVVHAADVMKDLTNDLSDLDLGGILTIANDPIKGRISLSKHIRLNGSIEKWLNEFSFGIYDSEGKLVDTIVVKANDEVKTSRELRYGKYTVAEIVDGSIVGGYTWTGAEFELNDGDNKIGINLDSNRFQFDIKEDGEIVRVEATNDYVRQPGGGGGGGGGGGSRSGGGGGGTTMITDPAVPLANLPEELVTLPEEDVPLAGLLPQTGDARNIAMWLLLFGGAGIGMLLAAMGLKKKKEEE